MGLPYGEEIMIVGRTMWTQSTSVTDEQTDRRTEFRSQRPCNAMRCTVIMEIKTKTIIMSGLPHPWLHSFSSEYSATPSSSLHHSFQSPWQQLTPKIQHQNDFHLRSVNILVNSLSYIWYRNFFAMLMNKKYLLVMQVCDQNRYFLPAGYNYSVDCGHLLQTQFRD